MEATTATRVRVIDRLHRAAHTMRHGTGFPARVQFNAWANLCEQAAALLADTDVPAFSELVLTTLKDPDWVCHPRRLDCEHESPHLMASCGAFLRDRRACDIPNGEVQEASGQ
jgi:hypothetical protein